MVTKVAETDEERIKLVDELQAWKTQWYQDELGSGKVVTRPGRRLFNIIQESMLFREGSFLI